MCEELPFHQLRYSEVHDRSNCNTVVEGNQRLKWQGAHEEVDSSHESNRLVGDDHSTACLAVHDDIFDYKEHVCRLPNDYFQCSPHSTGLERVVQGHHPYQMPLTVSQRGTRQLKAEGFHFRYHNDHCSGQLKVPDDDGGGDADKYGYHKAPCRQVAGNKGQLH